MTILEAHQNFKERHSKHTLGAANCIESVEGKSLLCVDLEEKRFVHITANETGTEKPKYVPFSDVEGIEYFTERPENHPLVAKPEQLLIKSPKKNIVIDCAHYDYRKLMSNLEGLVDLSEEDDENK